MKTNKAKNKIVDVASDVLSAPARVYYGHKSRKANTDAYILGKARATAGAPDFNDDGSVSDAFKAREVSETIKDRIRSKAMKEYKRGFGGF